MREVHGRGSCLRSMGVQEVATHLFCFSLLQAIAHREGKKKAVEKAKESARASAKAAGQTVRLGGPSTPVCDHRRAPVALPRQRS